MVPNFQSGTSNGQDRNNRRFEDENLAGPIEFSVHYDLSRLVDLCVWPKEQWVIWKCSGLSPRSVQQDFLASSQRYILDRTLVFTKCSKGGRHKSDKTSNQVTNSRGCAWSVPFEQNGAASWPNRAMWLVPLELSPTRFEAYQTCFMKRDASIHPIVDRELQVGHNKLLVLVHIYLRRERYG